MRASFCFAHSSDVGVPVGSTDGDTEGIEDTLGEPVGTIDGIAVGCDDGLLDGDAVGETEGNELGLSVGEADGVAEGCDEGRALG